MDCLEKLNLNDICRTCSSTENLISLYDEYSTENCFNEMLATCTSLTCYEHEGLPLQICTNCISDLNRSYKFALKCRATIDMLRMSLHNSNVISDQCSATIHSLKDPLKQTDLQNELSRELDVVKDEMELDNIKTEPGYKLEFVQLNNSIIEHIKVDEADVDEPEIPQSHQTQQIQDVMSTNEANHRCWQKNPDDFATIQYTNVKLQALRRIAATEKQRAKRANETPEQLYMRRTINCERQRMRRANATEEQMKVMRAHDAQWKRARRAQESQEARDIRRAINCEWSRVRRANETQEDADLRRAADAEWKRIRRANETQEERDLRRARQAERTRVQRANETQEERDLRRARQAARTRLQRANETQQDTDRRRAMQAEWQRVQRASKTYMQDDWQRANETQQEMHMQHVQVQQECATDMKWRATETQEAADLRCATREWQVAVFPDEKYTSTGNSTVETAIRL